jgi:hypothetical protein
MVMPAVRPRADREVRRPEREKSGMGTILAHPVDLCRISVVIHRRPPDNESPSVAGEWLRTGRVDREE